MEWVELISDLFKSVEEIETHPFLGMPPVMREWVGGRQPKGLSVGQLVIRNRHYERVLEVSRQDIRRDKSQQIRTRIAEFADSSKSHWASLLMELLNAAETSACYDGRPFFATDHEEGTSGVQSNSIQVDISETPAQLHGLPAVPSMEEVQFAIAAGLQQLWSIRDDRGEPMNEGMKSVLAFVPMPYVLSFNAACSAESTAALLQNLNPNLIGKLSVKVLASARLTWSNRFALFRTDAATKALIRQSETDIEFRAKAEGSEFEFDEDAWQFGIDTWRAVGFGHWQRACMVRLV